MSILVSQTSEKVRVELAERSYDILIGPGLIDGLGERVAALAPRARVAVVTDESVDALHGARIRAALAPDVELAALVRVPPGESSKSFRELERVVLALLDARLERGDLVIAVGGGVVGDLAGFAAAILRRGVSCVQVPTTLLSQVDSSVGGKTGIDTRHGKNLVGAFHQPVLVLADTALLDTLPEREFRAGYAELVKYGLIDDPGFFAWLEGAWRDVFSGGPERIRAIATSCRSKARVVAADEREDGSRALLNLGHTFGHALEAATGYSRRLIHGEAISIGMVLAFGFSAELGFCDASEEDRVARHLAAVGLPTRLSQVEGGLPDAERLVELIRQDKKVEHGALNFVLVRGIGGAFVERAIDPARLLGFLTRRLAQP